MRARRRDVHARASLLRDDISIDAVLGRYRQVANTEYFYLDTDPATLEKVVEVQELMKKILESRA